MVHEATAGPGGVMCPPEPDPECAEVKSATARLRGEPDVFDADEWLATNETPDDVETALRTAAAALRAHVRTSGPLPCGALTVA